MTNVRIRFHPSAASEVEAAVRWYAERSPVAARAFATEVNVCVERVGEAPDRWPRYLHDTRRYLFPNFPFSLVYRVRDEEIEIVALEECKEEINNIPDDGMLGYLRYEFNWDPDPRKSTWQAIEINRLITRRKAQREQNVEQLERDYEFMRLGLQKGGTAVVLALILVPAILAATATMFIIIGNSFLSGVHFVVVVLGLLGALIVYFSFVYGRQAKLSAAIAKNKIEIGSE